MSFQAMRAALLGERHSRKLRRLALEQRHSQGEGWPRPFLTCWITAVAPTTKAQQS